METLSLDQLKYPVGKFSFNKDAGAAEIAACIAEIEMVPAHLRKAVQGLTNAQLNTPYREGGWNLRQVVHHIADSHMNAYCRLKLAATEVNPTIKPYDENNWAAMKDSLELPVEISLSIIDPLHARMTHMLKNFSKDDWNRTVYHPEAKREMSVNFLIQLYAWHGRHHTAHITTLRARMKW
jgi:hypothetical protein